MLAESSQLSQNGSESKDFSLKIRQEMGKINFERCQLEGSPVAFEKN